MVRKKQWGIHNPENNSPSFKRMKMPTYKIFQEAKQADITISWVILLQIRLVCCLLFFFFLIILYSFSPCEYCCWCGTEVFTGLVALSRRGVSVTTLGSPEQRKTRRTSLPWEKETVKVGFFTERHPLPRWVSQDACKVRPSFFLLMLHH